MEEVLSILAFLFGIVVFLVAVVGSLVVGNQAWECSSYRDPGAHTRMMGGTCYLSTSAGWVQLDSFTALKQNAVHIDVAQ